MRRPLSAVSRVARAAGSAAAPWRRVRPGPLRAAVVLGLALWAAGCTTAPRHPALQTPAFAATPLLPVRDIVADTAGQGAHQLSPDGRRLLWIGRQGLGAGLFVRDLDTGAERHYPVRVPAVWARDSRHVLLHMDQGGNENTHVLRFDATAPTLALQDLTPTPRTRAFLHARLEGSDDLLIESNQRDPQVFDLWRWEAASGRLRLLARNPGDVARWLTDPVDGRLVARAARRGDPGQEQWAIEQAEAAAPVSAATAAPVTDEPPALTWTERFRIDFMEQVEPLHLAPDGRTLWALSSRGRDTLALVRLRLDDGQETVVLHDPATDVAGVVFSRRTQAPVAAWLEPDTQVWRVLDPAWADVPPLLAGSAHAGAPARITWMGGTDDERRLIASVLRDDGGETVLIDRDTGQRQVLAEATRTRLAARAPLALQQPRTWRARDGRTLHGYLTLPPGKAVGSAGAGPRLPTVVLVHGGPWARDLHLWNDPMPGFLANRGYAVLQVNYRGSTGYGRAFRDAAIGEFGRAMHTDLLDALDATIADGTTDPTRVAIMGHSFGGYASLTGMTASPGRFACAISGVGVTDLVRQIEDMPPYWSLGRPMWLRFAGDPADPAQRATLDDRSPLHHVAAVQGPILLLHGANDPRVRLDQAIRLQAALQAAGKTSTLHVFPHAGHGFHRWQDRLREYRLTEDFLAGCLGGRSGGFDLFELGAAVL